MTVLYPILCYNEACYKGTVLYYDHPNVSVSIWIEESISLNGISLALQFRGYD